MKRTLEITFLDGTKDLYPSEAWDDLIAREEGIVRVKNKGQTFALYPICNIKSIIAKKEGESN